jgi:hypothetical protein
MSIGAGIAIAGIWLGVGVSVFADSHTAFFLGFLAALTTAVVASAGAAKREIGDKPCRN